MRFPRSMCSPVLSLAAGTPCPCWRVSLPLALSAVGLGSGRAPVPVRGVVV